MNIVAWILFGIIAGIVADALLPQQQRGGILFSVVLGVIGSVAGGALSLLLFGVGITSSFNITSFAVAVVGALLIVMWSRMVKKI